MIKHSKKIIGFIFLLVPVIFFYRSCVPHKLNEATFYKDKNIELKVVRYLEVIPVHYIGPVFRVGCKSKNTKSKPKAWEKIKDYGWSQISTHTRMRGLGWDPNLNVLTQKAKAGYHVTDMDTIIYNSHDIGIKVTWDACGTFASWNANKIPEEYVNPEKYKSCLKDKKIKEDRGALRKGWGKANCKSFRFFKENRVLFYNMLAKKAGYASFDISSKAFLLAKTYRVITNNYGETWELVPVQKK